MIRPNNYLALDLELNTQNNKTTHIIEVGVVVGNFNDGIIEKKQWFVKPVVDLTGQLIIDYTLSDQITDLTGITQKDYDENCKSLSTVAQELQEIIQKHDTFVNPVVWGLGDSDELKSAFRSEGIHFPHFGRRIIDVKHFYLFIEAANGRSLCGGLRKSMLKHGMSFLGSPHRVAVDAENTLRFFFHLLKRQEQLEQIIQTTKKM
jgi:inhibitor of KinA sporulation pathway (predicted exonuclease)